jgi:hypothetical protein
MKIPKKTRQKDHSVKQTQKSEEKYRMKTLSLTTLIILFTCQFAMSAHHYGMGDQGFGKMDVDNDGFVTQEEYLAPFDMWDTDKDGTLSKEEWIKNHGGSMKGKKRGKKSFHGDAGFLPFDKVDADGNGFITDDEYAAKYPSTAGGFGLIDGDKSGDVDADEWESFMKSHSGMHGKKY